MTAFVRHPLIVLLCLGAVIIQMTYRVLGGYEFILLSLLSEGLLILNILDWVKDLFFKVDPRGPFTAPQLDRDTQNVSDHLEEQDDLFQVNEARNGGIETGSNQTQHSLTLLEKITHGVLAVILVYSLFLLINGRQDSSQAIRQPSKIEKIISKEIVIGRRIPLGWVELSSWNLKQQKNYKVIINFKEIHKLWEGQEVIVSVHKGLFSIPWVSSIKLDKEKYYSKVLTQFPRATEIWKELIYDHLDTQAWQEGLSKTLEYIDLFPDDYEFAKGVAASFGQRRMNRELIQILEKFLGKKEDYDLYNMLGFALAKIGQSERGIELIKTSIAWDPQNASAYYHLGYIYRDLGRFDESRAMFEKVLQIRPHFPEIQSEILKMSEKK
jgi:hypothetical protein